MKTFLKQERPLITPILSSQTEDDLAAEVKRSIQQGADAFCLPMENLPRTLRTRATVSRIAKAMEDKPLYVSCYRRNDCVEERDEDRAQWLLNALEWGATLGDIPGDFFCPTNGELTVDEEAVAKQKELVDSIHAMGKEALMSSHIFYDGVFHFIPKERAVEIAQAHFSRGVDIAKIVTCADTEEQLAECYEAIPLLKKTVPIPTVFLCSGKLGLRHRTGCGLIYEPMVFVKERQFATAGSPQMAIERMKSVFCTAGLISE